MQQHGHDGAGSALTRSCDAAAGQCGAVCSGIGIVPAFAPGNASPAFLILAYGIPDGPRIVGAVPDPAIRPPQSRLL